MKPSSKQWRRRSPRSPLLTSPDGSIIAATRSRFSTYEYRCNGSLLQQAGAGALMTVPVGGGAAVTKRKPVEPAPGPLENYAARFDDLFANRAQRQGFRRYVEGLLLSDERNKTLTALANTEPVVGAQRKEAQSLQWFLTESGWDPEAVNRRRVELMLEEPKTAPVESGALVIDETGDRKDGNATAHVGKQYLGGIGKTENGVVSVSSLYAEERLY